MYQKYPTWIALEEKITELEDRIKQLENNKSKYIEFYRYIKNKEGK